MDEDSGIKAAPVTRLRRRLSVETEDAKSPSAPSTPTKKRNTRLAAKPQLELIDELAVTNSPKRATRKSISRDIAESEEKPITPARRSARTKSNTSLVSEVDDKPLTPARRSTRMRSNTSIISETTQSVDSPRAKRAVARSNSQIGSDTETPLTPMRTRRARKASTSSIDKEEATNANGSAVTPGRTRRTRKGSTSSIDLPVEAAQLEKQSLLSEVIVEEPEGKLRKSTSDKDIVDSKDDSPTRKSPRLIAKNGRKSKSEHTNETPQQSSKSPGNNEIVSITEELSQTANTTDIAVSQTDISMTSANLLLGLNKKLQKDKISNKNKSMSDIEDTNESKKRKRTKSWTTLYAPSPSPESTFYSENEKTKKKHGEINVKTLSVVIGSGNGPNQNCVVQEKDENKETNLSKKNRNSSKSLSESTKDVDISNESYKENILSAAVTTNTSGAEFLFEKAPNADVKSMVFIDDSDSNSGSTVKQSKQNVQNFVEDQCVPIVFHQSKTPTEEETITDQINIFAINNINEKVGNDNSVEPMDIDETIPENVSLTVDSDQDKKSRKSSLSIPQETESNIKDTSNRSNRKSSVSFSKSLIADTSKLNYEEEKSKTSLITQEDVNNTKESRNKSKRKSSLSYSPAQDTVSENVDKISSGKKSRKSSAKKVSKCGSVTGNELTDENSLANSISKVDNIGNDNDSIHNQEIAFNELSHSKHSRKSSISMAQDTTNISNRKSLSKSHEKTENESKSTLVLSQIKDMSQTPQDIDDLSKSINIADTNKDSLINKNLALNYMTSTPVQQKNVEKLAMQVNTSVISPMNESKNEIKVPKTTPQKDISMTSKSSVNDSSDEESEESDAEESSQNKNKLFDDQAEVAGEDYESGDSQDDEERQYIRDNEIINIGETLTSEEEISNDSDYEKDSFLVSSDEEDHELLSGSGDDLNLSDNDLTLSARSKKKYNERKLKEQKKASREMFEARHGQKSDMNSKKSNRNRLDSTLLKSDEDIMPPKKNKRMRLESILETNDTKPEENISNKNEEDIRYKKKKSKRLSESVCNESVMNEKEITIYNQNTIQKDDPLAVQIKPEPKTPQKELEISTVHITDEVEQIHIDENVSMAKFNKTGDPLQASIIQNSDDDDDSISENEEITNNYDSVLKDLNKESKKQIKYCDISLNLNNKNKAKTKQAIIDELNLTETKISKKNDSLQTKEKSVKRVLKKLVDTDESSDSINLQLLFSDDSNGSDQYREKKKTLEENKESYISLKKTRASTDISQDMKYADDNSQMSNNKKKGNNIKSIQSGTTAADGDISIKHEGSLNFFIDTKGDLSGTTIGNNAVDESDSNDAPVEFLYVSEKKKMDSGLKTPTSEKKKKLSESPAGSKTPSSEKKAKNEFHNPDSEKKKKNKQPHEDTTATKTPSSEKKAKNEFHNPDSEKNKKNKQPHEDTTATKTPSSEKKAKNEIHNPDSEKKKKNKQPHEDTTATKTPASEKKAKNEFHNPDSEKKKKNKQPHEDTTATKTPSSEKRAKNEFHNPDSEKKKKNKQPHDDTTAIKTPSSEKKAKNESRNPDSEKKKKNKQPNEDTTAIIDVSPNSANEKKNTKNTTESCAVSVRSDSAEHIDKVEEDTTTQPKKHKRKRSVNKSIDDIDPEVSKVLNSSQKLNESIKGNKNKKIKISTSLVDVNQFQENFSQVNGHEKHLRAEKKSIKNSPFDNQRQQIETSGAQVKVGMKRKERDDDEGGKLSKVFKKNVFDKVYVPRLPHTIIEQLEDKPEKEKHGKRMTKVVSTSNFDVEDTTQRNNKPSDFPEETVCLNNDDNSKAKKITNVKKPKILLPFLPTVSTSDSGFTTKFQVHVFSQRMDFVAQNNEVPNFKTEYLNNKKKKLRTYDLFKKHRNMKLSKY